MDDFTLLAFRLGQDQFSTDCCRASAAPLPSSTPSVETLEELAAAAIGRGVPFQRLGEFLLLAGLVRAACNHGAQFGRAKQADTPKKRGRK